MKSSYERELGRELAVVGISGRLRARILDEFADHLACDPGADLGEPRELACQFADQLGSARAMTAAVGSFAALVVAGLVFAVAFAFSGSGAFGAVPGGAPAIGRIATGVGLLAPQLSFVAGILAALRWLRRRGTATLPAAEARVIVRRAAVAVLAGIASMASLGTLAIVYRHHASATWGASRSWLPLSGRPGCSPRCDPSGPPHVCVQSRTDRPGTSSTISVASCPGRCAGVPGGWP